MIEKLEIHHLRTLDALYRFGNISAAAESLDLSQQAISQQLKKLRDILGDQLFVRTGHGMAPTPYAKLIEPHIQQVLTHLHAIPAPEAFSLAKVERTLVISATDYTQKVIVTQLVAELRKAAPKVKVVVANIESANLTRKMRQGEIDLAFTSHGYVPEGLLSEALFTERYLCVSADAGLAGEGEISLERLVARDFIVTSPGTGGFAGSADAWFEQQGLRRNVTISAPSFHIAQEYLRATDMVAFMPSRLLPCAGLFEIPLNKYPPGYEVVAAFHPSAKNDPLIMWALSTVKQRLSHA
ncbi:LysR family transcriptional regulator [Hahella sp. KA22]|uniref:LysR family transcriptional regulator n=1 Tax=Hahella sp. KA22 TaxID=1628392 RepID=UPI000FDD877E|nr:LysR family transcriptional regulator [Hahella sp. KA22]AZZ93508.1 LysR family transcriptional regulator [Hahella sp. KA22]QAY56883.1 LysR family transcriptional regulator [Hahella sp. KA22]